VSGRLRQHRYVLHDRDTKFCAEFRVYVGLRLGQSRTVSSRAGAMTEHSFRSRQPLLQPCERIVLHLNIELMGNVVEFTLKRSSCF